VGVILKLFFGITFPLLFVLVVFQNCGGLSSNESMKVNLSDGKEPFEDEIVDVELEPFMAGETVALHKLPFQILSSDVTALGRYLNSQHPKMIAFSEEGEAFIFTNEIARDQAEATRVGLERCQLLYERYCSLYAEGNIISQNQDDFHANFNNNLPRQTVFDAMRTPAHNAHWQEMLATNYANSGANFKAIALSKRGVVMNGWSNISQDEANRRALEFCQTWGHQCTLYAVDEQVVFDYEDFEWSPNLVDLAPNPLNIARIPFITDSQRLEMTPLIEGMSADTKFVIALSRFGHYDIKVDSSPGTQISEATLQSALTDCNSRITPPAEGGRGHECFIYSERRQITMTQETLNRYALRIE
jgi:hypothetical protein